MLGPPVAAVRRVRRIRRIRRVRGEVGSRQLGEQRRQSGGRGSSRGPRVGAGEFGARGGEGGAQRAVDLGGVEGADEGRGERVGDLVGQEVGALGVGRGQPEAQAGEGEDVLAHRADPVLGLPQAAARQADPDVQGVMPQQARQQVGVRVPVGPQRLRSTEQQAPVGSARAELGLGCEGDVGLQPAGQQERPDGAGADRQVPVVQGAEFGGEPPRPVRHRVRDLPAYGQHQVGVRPAVAGAGRVRARERGPHHGGIGLRTRDQPLPQAVPLLDREHRAAPSGSG